ncbi:hypothetical protein DPX16_6188 [Anabarilius grahami]|uniref:Uncharacterized protein n=1 Tax=Anabarilius grahami TaxID=495550 RepID=A0A3N0Z2X0_ANAGA|nr:hypothetical protein DPX16_6188 [Anabarilius grahami]
MVRDDSGQINSPNGLLDRICLERRRGRITTIQCKLHHLQRRIPANEIKTRIEREIEPYSESRLQTITDGGVSGLQSGLWMKRCIEKRTWHQAQESMNRDVMHHMTTIFHAALVVQYSAVACSITCIYMQMTSKGPEQEREGELINE